MEPSLEEVRRIAAAGDCRRIPVKREILSDSLTTIQAIAKLRAASRHCFLLESAEPDEHWGRYTFLGFHPKLEVTCTNGLLRIRESATGRALDEAASEVETAAAFEGALETRDAFEGAPESASETGTASERVPESASETETSSEGASETESEVTSAARPGIAPGAESVIEMRVDHPGDALREILADHKSAIVEGMPPFTGGLVGYFSYDYLKYAEPSLRYEDDLEDFLDVDLMLFDDVIAFDSYRQKIMIIGGVDADDVDESYARAEVRLEEIEKLLLEGPRADFPPLELDESLEPRFSRERYMGMVESAIDHIKEGDIFQVVLSNPRRAKAEGSLFDAYRLLRCENPSPYMFYFVSDDVELAGSSPETLVRLQDGTLFTYPLAGTRPRSEDSEEDARRERELLEDEKELAEHNMLVDLGRTDLGRISEIGTVRVDDYMQVLKFSKVMHIGSTVSSTIASDKDALDAVDSILPAGTLSGAPKIRACQIIHELEDDNRGIYGGAVGYLDFTGGMDLCIAIRLAYKKNGVVCIQSGAGIVADSDPSTEFDECVNKAKAVIEAVERSQGGVA